MQSLLQDLRFAARRLVKDRWFTARRDRRAGAGHRRQQRRVHARQRRPPPGPPARQRRSDHVDRFPRPARPRRGRVVPGLRGLAHREPHLRRHDARPERHDDHQRRRAAARVVSRRVHLGERVRCDRREGPARTRLRPRRRQGGCACGCADQRRHLENALRVRSRDYRQGGPRQHDSRDDRRRDARRLQMAVPERGLDADVPTVARVPAAAPGAILHGLRPPGRRRHARAGPQRDEEHRRAARRISTRTATRTSRRRSRRSSTSSSALRSRRCSGR